MRKTILPLFCLLTTFGFGAEPSTRQEAPPGNVGSPLLSVVGTEAFRAAGFEKLSAQEQQVVVSLLNNRVAPDTLITAAFSQMQKDGWERITIVGMRVIDYRHYLVYENAQGRKFATDLRAVSLPRRGTFWGKLGVRNTLDHLMDERGFVESFYSREAVELIE